MFYLVSYNDEYLSLAIHADSESKEECQEAMRELLISRIQDRIGKEKKTADAIYKMAKKANSPDEVDAVLSEHGIDIHVYEYGASIDNGSYIDIYQIISYMPNQKQ